VQNSISNVALYPLEHDLGQSHIVDQKREGIAS